MLGVSNAPVRSAAPIQLPPRSGSTPVKKGRRRLRHRSKSLLCRSLCLHHIRIRDASLCITRYVDALRRVCRNRDGLGAFFVACTIGLQPARFRLPQPPASIPCQQRPLRALAQHLRRASAAPVARHCSAACCLACAVDLHPDHFRRRSLLLLLRPVPCAPGTSAGS